MAETDFVRRVCGLVMPISLVDGCDASHWKDVLSILSAAVEGAGFHPNLVSAADDVGIIQKRIIQNLYDNPIVVVDVSCKNPNVMFELGIRLAFDKPTIVVKDDQTSYSFDTSPIEHLTYPRDLRYSKIIEFSETLSDKIKATDLAANSNPEYTTFLKHFGEFVVAKIDKKTVTRDDYILSELRNLSDAVNSLRKSETAQSEPLRTISILIPDYDPENIRRLARRLLRVSGVITVSRSGSETDKPEVRVSFRGEDVARLIDIVEEYKKQYPDKDSSVPRA